MNRQVQRISEKDHGNKDLVDRDSVCSSMAVIADNFRN